MKVGEKYPVEIAGQIVAYAQIKELGEGTATLIVPATQVVMATRTELTYETPAEPSKQVIIDAPVASGNDEEPQEPPAPPSAPVAEPDAPAGDESPAQPAPPEPVSN